VTFFNGKEHALKLDSFIRNHVSANTDLLSGKLGIVQIGDNPSSKKYISLKQKYCTSLGLSTELLHLSADTPFSEVSSQVKAFFLRQDITGGIIQLPLPSESLKNVLSLIPPEKDIDLLSPTSLEIFYNGDLKRLSPVVSAVKYFIGSVQIETQGLKCLVIGEGDLVGKPVAYYLRKLGAEVTINTNYKEGDFVDAQLLVLSAGVPGLVRGENISNGCNVIDFGSSIVNGVTKGDLDLNSDLSALGTVSPSPGGMGPLVIRFLTMNFLNIRL
jgi:methylenetetrahydrofolate dehydrogenase (NADP+)/methenyltetrahydrofolate cyclohydrolase